MAENTVAEFKADYQTWKRSLPSEIWKQNSNDKLMSFWKSNIQGKKFADVAKIVNFPDTQLKMLKDSGVSVKGFDPIVKNAAGQEVKEVKGFGMDTLTDPEANVDLLKSKMFGSRSDVVPAGAVIDNSSVMGLQNAVPATVSSTAKGGYTASMEGYDSLVREEAQLLGQLVVADRNNTSGFWNTSTSPEGKLKIQDKLAKVQLKLGGQSVPDSYVPSEQTQTSINNVSRLEAELGLEPGTTASKYGGVSDRFAEAGSGLEVNTDWVVPPTAKEEADLREELKKKPWDLSKIGIGANSDRAVGPTEEQRYGVAGQYAQTPLDELKQTQARLSAQGAEGVYLGGSYDTHQAALAEVNAAIADRDNVTGEGGIFGDLGAKYNGGTTADLHDQSMFNNASVNGGSLGMGGLVDGELATYPKPTAQSPTFNVPQFTSAATGGTPDGNVAAPAQGNQNAGGGSVPQATTTAPAIGTPAATFGVMAQPTNSYADYTSRYKINPSQAQFNTGVVPGTGPGEGGVVLPDWTNNVSVKNRQEAINLGKGGGQDASKQGWWGKTKDWVAKGDKQGVSRWEKVFGGTDDKGNRIYGGVGRTLGLATGLANTWIGMENLQLAKDQHQTSKDQWQANYDQQMIDVKDARKQRAALGQA